MLGIEDARSAKRNTVRSILERVLAFFTKESYVKLLEGAAASTAPRNAVLNPKAARQLKVDPRGYEETALRWTYQFAK